MGCSDSASQGALCIKGRHNGWRPIPAVSATCFKQVAALENAVLPSLVISGLQELFEVFKSELQARSRARLFKRWAIGLVVACLVLLGVNAATVSTW